MFTFPVRCVGKSILNLLLSPNLQKNEDMYSYTIPEKNHLSSSNQPINQVSLIDF